MSTILQAFIVTLIAAMSVAVEVQHSYAHHIAHPQSSPKKYQEESYKAPAYSYKAPSSREASYSQSQPAQLIYSANKAAAQSYAQHISHPPKKYQETSYSYKAPQASYASAEASYSQSAPAQLVYSAAADNKGAAQSYAHHIAHPQVSQKKYQEASYSYKAPEASSYSPVESKSQFSYSHSAPAYSAHSAPAQVVYSAAPAYKAAAEQSGYSGEEHKDYYAEPKYIYKYGVEDPHTDDKKSQEESRDGEHTKGQYSLVEPDGTVLTVQYSVVGKSGFNAKVLRSGHPKH